MFDGVFTRSASPPLPSCPAPLDIRAMLPMLRAKEASIAVEAIAMATAENVIANARWLAMNWGPDADLRDHNHPARVAALDPSSPTWRLSEARAALSTACWRYRMTTGQDGLMLAQATIAQAYGAAVAKRALKPLLDAARDWSAIDEVLMQDGPEPLPPESEPTPAQRQAGMAAMTDWALSDPSLDELRHSLHGLLASIGGPVTGCSRPATSAGPAGVRHAISQALRGGVELDRIQIALNSWSVATGGPQINITANGAAP